MPDRTASQGYGLPSTRPHPLPLSARPPKDLGLEAWVESAAVHERMGHGDWPRWLAAIGELPESRAAFTLLDGQVCVGTALPTSPAQSVLETLKPWRKGPFRVAGINVDSEWRSDFKWSRIAPHIELREGNQVLDVGGGNGYFGFRLLAAGAGAVVGLDPTLRFLAQYELLHRLSRSTQQWILPLRLEEVPHPAASFDLVMSMGVLYHQRDPAAHLRALTAQAAPKAQVLVETLILPEHAIPTYGSVLTPSGRYARMRNVWAIPSLDTLLQWMKAAGLAKARCVNLCMTRPDEQRRTQWMQGPSLQDFLHPDDPTLTEEGLPAPLRAIVIAEPT